MAVLEICTNSIQSALNAEAGGADRIELCQNLEAGGITPSFGLIKKVRELLRIPIHVLVRPRAGDFVYDDHDFGVMLEDVRTCRQLGCEGVVVGVLTPQSRIDLPRTKQLVQAAGPMSVTFHRAFDDCFDQSQALEDVITAKCTRILTSGAAGSALEGHATIARLVEKATDRVIILPGAGITATNVSHLAKLTKATEYHASAKETLVTMHKSMFQGPRLQTCTDEVRSLKEALTNGPFDPVIFGR